MSFAPTPDRVKLQQPRRRGAHDTLRGALRLRGVDEIQEAPQPALNDRRNTLERVEDVRRRFDRLQVVMAQRAERHAVGCLQQDRDVRLHGLARGMRTQTHVGQRIRDLAAPPVFRDQPAVGIVPRHVDPDRQLRILPIEQQDAADEAFLEPVDAGEAVRRRRVEDAKRAVQPLLLEHALEVRGKGDIADGGGVWRHKYARAATEHTSDALAAVTLT